MDSKPLISVITPTYNCARYIRECIESVMAQNYENFEHIVVDGASSDGTVEILKQYAHLKWISEPDSGEAEALNKALRLARGDIIGWLNADDYYLDGTFRRVVSEINPEAGRHAVYGKTNIVDGDRTLIWSVIPVVPIKISHLVRWFRDYRVFQPSIFYSQEVCAQIGLYREELYFSIDYEYWLRVAQKYQFHFVDQTFASSRLIRDGAKSSEPILLQIESKRRVAKCYLTYLSAGERLAYWLDYSFYLGENLPMVGPLSSRLRSRLRLRTRLRHLLGGAKGAVS